MTGTAESPVLHLKGVEHVYPNGTRALDGVTMSIGKGMFGLLGPNGAGKSSLMRTIATLQTPTAGEIRFGDIDVLAEPDRLRSTLGYLPQDFGVYPRVSALRPARSHGVAEGHHVRGRSHGHGRDAAGADQSVERTAPRRSLVSPAACASASASRRR